MTLAAFGLVVHTRTAEAWRAGRVYLVLSLAAEMAILAGLLMLAAVLGNARFQDIPVDAFATFGALPWWLMFAGFALKLGVFPLHVWLPLAHPVAPVPASAVLSGLLVKAGLLGMLRLLPPLTLPAVEWLVALGLFTAAFGALVGLTQPRLKTVLAYSTISQMGLLLAGFAAVQSGLGQSLALAAVGLFALHHGLNKIALFLAAGHAIRSPIARALFLLPALSLAGLPPTSGALAKDALKHSVSAAQLDGWLLAVSLSSALTTVLLLHAYRIACARPGGRESMHPAWVAAVVAGIAVPWLWAPIAFDTGMVWSGLWPLLLGVVLHQAGRHLLRGRRALQLPEGDLVVPLERVVLRMADPLRRLEAGWRKLQPVMPDVLPGAAKVARIERALGKVSVVGLALLLGLLGLWGLLGAR
jgi:formate hydrogenlyase subunit 3/multisubunit Na+/H+ antiporter MnhD subunit